MSLNIKNSEAHRLARELAALTGESLATAVTESLRERLVRERAGHQDPLAQRLLAIGKDCAARLGEARTIDHGGLLYDGAGLPR
jgi:antitoxin VapB